MDDVIPSKNIEIAIDKKNEKPKNINALNFQQDDIKTIINTELISEKKNLSEEENHKIDINKLDISGNIQCCPSKYASSFFDSDDDEISVDRPLSNLESEIKKKDFAEHIQSKLCKIHKRLRYANHKYNDVRYQYNSLSITIIILSFLVTIFEAIKNSIDCKELSEPNIKYTLNFLPLLLSTAVSFFTALIKFNKYEEKIESIVKANEKSIYTIAEMKKIRESLYFCYDPECISAIMQDFEKNIYPKYLSNNCDIEKELNDTDYSKYIKKVNRIEIEHKHIDKKKDNILEKIDRNETLTDSDNELYSEESYNSDKICCWCT